MQITIETVIKYLVDIIYTIALLIIIYGLLRSIKTIFIDKNQNHKNNSHVFISYYPNLNINKGKMQLGEALSLALSFIVCVEVLKTYYITSNKQLFRIFVIMIINRFTSYFLDKERKEFYQATNI